MLQLFSNFKSWTLGNFLQTLVFFERVTTVSPGVRLEAAEARFGLQIIKAADTSPISSWNHPRIRAHSAHTSLIANSPCESSAFGLLS